nr:MAG TPA: hypothetical protein [Caudoviricetes sp.]
MRHKAAGYSSLLNYHSGDDDYLGGHASII